MIGNNRNFTKSMKPHIYLKVLLFIIAISLCTATCRAMPIVKDNIPAATIVIAANSSESIQESAKTLQHYIAKSTGATLPITNAPGAAISIRLQDAAALPGSPKLDQDGFILQGLDAKTFVIAGGSEQGIEFGVYDFLERYLGVRWLMPGEMGEDVPAHATLDIPAQKVLEEPVYLSRRLGPGSVLGRGADNPNGEWAVHNRAVWRVMANHNLLNIFPPKDYAKTHPEFYAFLGGKRAIPQQGNVRWQPNFSAPDIVDEGAGQVEKYFQEHPDATSYSLAMNDAGGFDQSPESLARRNGKKNSQKYEDVSDDYFLWANAVAQKVLLKYPGKWFGTLAYRELTDPPKAEIGVNDHIIPFMTQERLRWIDPELRKIDQENTEKWAAVAKNLGWYDYVYGSWYFVPREWPHTMQEYLSWGAAHHVRFYISELYPNWGEGPKGWILAKLLWNPNQDVDALLDDWYTHAAGEAAAPKLREYFAIWEKFWTQDILQSKWWSGAGPYLNFNNEIYLADIPKSYIERSTALLNEAYELADTPERKMRVDKLRDVWLRFYKPNIVVYQGEHEKREPVQTEAQALAMMDEAIAVTEASQTRQDFLRALPSYRSDPFYNFMAARPSDIDKHFGGDWKGDSLLWDLLPWVKKSAAVKARIEKLASDVNPAMQQNIHLLLSAASGVGKQLLANPSFEEGTAHWDLQQILFNYPASYKFNDANNPQKSTLESAVQVQSENVHSGKSSLLVAAGHDGIKTLQFLHISQDVPYQTGNYYLEAQFYQPKNSPMSYVIGQVQFLDANGKEIKNVPGISDENKANLTPGEWTTFRAPIVVPETKVPAAKLRVTIIVRTLTVVPRGDFSANQKTYVDDVNLYRIQ